MTAGSAAVRGLTVMTRNTTDFRPFKVRLPDLFKPARARIQSEPVRA